MGTCFSAFVIAVALTMPIGLSAQVPAPLGQDAATDASVNPELIGTMTRELGITPKQAIGGTGALLGLAKSKLKADEFAKVSSAIPGTEALIKAAPTAAPALGSLGVVGGIASLGVGFKSLGMMPEMAPKMVPVLTKYVESKGSAAAAQLLTTALR